MLSAAMAECTLLFSLFHTVHPSLYYRLSISYALSFHQTLVMTTLRQQQQDDDNDGREQEHIFWAAGWKHNQVEQELAQLNHMSTSYPSSTIAFMHCNVMMRKRAWQCRRCYSNEHRERVRADLSLAEEEGRAINASHTEAVHGFVDLFRRASPYIAGHRGRTFVVALPGEVVADDASLSSTLADMRILHALGVRVVLVLGASTQIDELLHARNIVPRFVGHNRVTDADSLSAAMAASGSNTARVQAALSKGHKVTELRKHASDLHGGPTVSVAQGNFIAAKRRGVVNGVDFQDTGHVRYVDAPAISERLDAYAFVPSPGVYWTREQFSSLLNG